MVDLTGLDLSEEQAAQITALFDSEVGGLKNKVEELLGEKKTVQQGLTEKEQALEDARNAASKAHEERLISEGKTAELKAFYEEQLAATTAELTASAQAASDALMQRDRSEVLNRAKSLIHENYRDISEDKLSNMLKISYNDQKQPITEFIYGDKVVATNVEEFKGWASEQDSFKNILKGVESSGASTTQSQGGGAASGGDTKSKLAQRLKAQGLT